MWFVLKSVVSKDPPCGYLLNGLSQLVVCPYWVKGQKNARAALELSRLEEANGFVFFPSRLGANHSKLFLELNVMTFI